MYGYKCDYCGTPVNVDPSEERICSRCEEQRKKNRQAPVKIEYRSQERAVCHAG
ncbi:MAG: hypothetical protein RR496_06055 [Lachnospiraceae bacterium]